jgi:NAD(P)-dependent dehydrogenase (short-subunit alcohol dehydrogenase family)
VTETQSLAGKTAVIAGAASSIGLATAQSLHRLGANVVLSDLAKNLPAVEALFSERAISIAFDIRRDEDIAALITKTSQEFGGLDILVNCVVAYPDAKNAGPGASRDAWLNHLNVNLVGAAIIVDAARPALALSDIGTVVHISSAAARTATPGTWIYPVGKAALEHLIRSQALDLAADGIRVNGVAPAWTWSAPVASIFGDVTTARTAGARFHPLQRIGNPDEVAAAVAFLAGPASSWVTGAIIAVDGGYSILGPEGFNTVLSNLPGWP